MKEKRNKFTLVELLVVIAAIGILASLLMPSLSKARNSSLGAICKSNLRQMGVGYSMLTDLAQLPSRPNHLAGQVLDDWTIDWTLEPEMGVSRGTVNTCPLKKNLYPDVPSSFGHNNFFSYWGSRYLASIDKPDEIVNMGDSDVRPYPEAVTYWLYTSSISDFHVNKKTNLLMFDFSVQPSTRAGLADASSKPRFRDD